MLILELLADTGNYKQTHIPQPLPHFSIRCRNDVPSYHRRHEIIAHLMLRQWLENLDVIHIVQFSQTHHRFGHGPKVDIEYTREIVLSCHLCIENLWMTIWWKTLGDGAHGTEVAEDPGVWWTGLEDGQSSCSARVHVSLVYVLSF